MAAGNRFHQFINTVISAMVTNRTILYKYMDESTCLYHWETQQQIKKTYSKSSCRSTYTESACLKVIDLPEWIPRWEDWAPRLNLDLEDATIVDVWATKSYQHVPRWVRDVYPMTTKLNFTQVDAMPDRLVDFPVFVTRNPPQDRKIQNQMYATEHAKRTWPKLWNKSNGFLYGFLHAHLLPLHESQRVSSPNLPENTLAIAVHSRHPRNEYTGEDISMEIDCIEKLLKQHGKNRPCHVCLMSDRPLTVQRLTEWTANSTACTTFSVKHDSVVHAKEKEHGPHAGLGFLQELSVCGGKSNAVVGNSHGSTSSLLLDASIEYRNTNVPRCWFHRLQPWEIPK